MGKTETRRKKIKIISLRQKKKLEKRREVEKQDKTKRYSIGGVAIGILNDR